MNPHQFVKVFDVRDTSLLDWTSTDGFVFVAIGLALVAVPAIFPGILTLKDIPFVRLRALQSRLFRYGYAAFAIAMTAISFGSIYPLYQRHKAMLDQHSCCVVVGPVEHLVSPPYTGHGSFESFAVQGVTFEYSDYEMKVGFHRSASHGGPIRSDSYVRIWYDPDDMAILRLEIRDFKAGAAG
jgi:hypothetical protein